MPKVISDHTKNLKLYINLATLFIMKSKSYVFILHVACLGETANSRLRVFLKAKNYVVCTEFTMGSKFHFSLMENTFFLKLIEVMEYLIISEIRIASFYVNHPSYFKSLFTVC